ncbi:hypothetical protein ABL78_1099 [Leptomonas seymouri]|uniref:Cyclic nucleotide-binding domain-containing protein n=1 Tax=Leptomonas seymouri TaxID=5684 RepID=A0A0N0P8E0_LEPSE|nr:hypothetical protein ABL78_1099 [Leptomonas seymouri]|eukprot:KPI89836.1 hypothetical protein ABL78_1099 [Leptomonas seymouri]
MLSVSSGMGASGIAEGGAGFSAARRRRSSQSTIYHRRASSIAGGKRRSSAALHPITEVSGISMDCLTYINTTLNAMPGVALREYFVPVMRLKKQLLLRQRRTRECFPKVGTAAYTKMVTGAVSSLAKSISSAGADLALDSGATSFDVDPAALAELLMDKFSPVCMEAGSVLGYPREPPEASFLYVVLSGTVTAVHFQPQSLPAQSRRTGGGSSRKERRMYFTSAKDVVRLCGGGAVPEAALLLDDYNGTESGAVVEAASTSNVSTAIQRSLRHASRTVGQPTLQVTRTEQLRGPVVLGAAEAIGLAPCKYVSYIASAEPSGLAGKKGNMIENNKSDDVEMVQAFRIRTADVHSALIQLAVEQQAVRQAKTPFRYVPWCAAAAGEAVARGAARTIADLIVAARRRTLCNDYAATELLMRQSWLLQDAPSHTIRTLIAHMEPRTYMPGEVIACPHTPSGERQLCFLRRGRLSVCAVPKAIVVSATATGGGRRSQLNSPPPQGSATPRVAREGCECRFSANSSAGAGPTEIIESGASFGELSVLFQEPRSCVLRAATVCDTWCLPHRSFVSLMQRDDSLRDSLLRKAAVLRIEWMSEQRFTRALAQQLRAGSELLRPLPDIAIRLIQERLEPVVYAPGSLVVSTSTKCKEVIFIMQGSISTICEGVATYGPGDVLGEGCLVPHRWPLGLAARTMVEGWRIKTDQLIDALRRVDKLHHYSGLVTSQTLQLMKQIFGNPLPPIEVDVVGRQRMPTVGAAPGGTSYLAYGRSVSEVQLKVTCFLYRDYVRWEDINYSTIDGGMAQLNGVGSLDTLARELAIHRLDGGKTKSVAAALNQQQQPATQPKQQKPATESVTTESPAGKDINKGTAAIAEARKRAPAAGSGRNAVRASSSSRLSGGPALRAGSARGPRSRVASAGAFLVRNAFLSDEGRGNPSNASTPAAAAGAGAPSRSLHSAGAREKHPISLPPRLQHMTRLLEERNRAWAAERQHEATLAQQEANQRETAVRDQVALHASATSAQSPFSPRGKDKEALEDRIGGAPTPLAAPSIFSLAGIRPAPVHIFLQADKPKYELALKEAISIGYVMQLPDITHIQHSVSLIDPDVVLGPPGHRARRYLMSITPNDRYNKHNFLFAAAALEDGGSAESQKAAAEAAAEATVRSRARKLYMMMRAAVVARMDAEMDQVGSTPHRCMSREFSTDESMGTHPIGALMLMDELQAQSPKNGAEDGAGSPPSFLKKTQSPQRAPQLLNLPARLNSVAAPSPLGGSSEKSGPKASDEALQCMLQRDPARAVDLLRKHYSAPWGFAGTNGGGDGGANVSGLQSSGCHVAELRSTNGSGFFFSTPDASEDLHRRARRPLLLDRLSMAVAGSHVASLEALPCSLHSRDRVNVESHSTEFAAGVLGSVGTEDLATRGEVVLTNITAPTFPSLVSATARDRWRSGNNLTQGRASHASGANAVAAGTDAAVQRKREDSISAGTNAPATAATTALAVESEGNVLCDYFYSNIRRRYPPALFVEGYGPLVPLSEQWVEYPPAIRFAAAAGSALRGAREQASGGRGSADRASTLASGSRVSHLPSAIAVAAALRGNSTPLRAGDSSCGYNFMNPGGAFGDHSNSVAAPRMEPFVMPTLEDTNVVIRRIQRDVKGLNAVALEQRRERELARLRNGRIVRHRTAVAAALATPDEEERVVLEMWRGHFARIDRDTLRRASVPAALREEGGPDYMKRELRRLSNAPVPVEDPLLRYTSDMQMWQEHREQQQEHGGKGVESPLLITSSLTVPGGGAGGGNARDGPQRVVATIGASRLGFLPAPLQSPAAHMSAADSKAWARQREDFFAAYMEMLERPNKRAGEAPTLAIEAPTLRFTPAPLPAKLLLHSDSHKVGERASAADNADTPCEAAFGGQAAGPTGINSYYGGGASEQPPIVSSAMQAAGSVASIPFTPLEGAAVEDSAELHLRRPKPELPARYESTPIRSYSTEEQGTPSAVDHRVALTPPREIWNADDTQGFMEGSEEDYSSGESEGEEEEEEPSAVLGTPGLAGTIAGGPTAADAPPASVSAAVLSSKDEEGEVDKQARDDSPGNAQEDEGEWEGHGPEVEYDEGEQAEEASAVVGGEESDSPAWLDM